jgi:hypothetical protein
MHAEEQSLGDVYLRICKDALEKSSCAVGKDVLSATQGVIASTLLEIMLLIHCNVF